MECSVYKIPNWNNLAEEDGKVLCLLTHTGYPQQCLGRYNILCPRQIGSNDEKDWIDQYFNFFKKTTNCVYMHGKRQGGNSPTYSSWCAIVGILIFFFVVIFAF